MRRATNDHSATVHRLLKHLEHNGYSAAPKFQGIDDKGRETLSYIHGSTDFPREMWRDEITLSSAVHLLRTYHEVTAHFKNEQADNWAFTYSDSAQHEIICHNDFAPYNMVFDKGAAIAIIDFDLAGPGPRLRDLAYLAYWLAPLSFSASDMSSFSENDLANGNPRLKRICAIYGTKDHQALLAMVLEVLRHMGDAQATEKMIGAPAAHKLSEGGHFAHWQAEAAAFQTKLPQVLRNLQKDK